MTLAATIKAMAAAGCSVEQIAAVAEQFDQEEKVRLIEKSAQATPYTIYGISPKEWYALRHLIFDRDGHKCVYCGSDGEGVSLHCDHVIPWSKGGESIFQNLVTACRFCNSSKRDRDLSDWICA